MSGLKNKSWLSIVLFMSILFIGIVTAGLAGVFNDKSVKKGIYIENTDVSRLSAEKAKKSVVEGLEKTYPAKNNITLVFEGYKLNVAPEEIDLRFLVDEAVKEAILKGREGNKLKQLRETIYLYLHGYNIEVDVSYSKEKIKNFLKGIKEDYDVTERDAEILYENEVIEFIPECYGRRLDIDINTELIENSLKRRKFDAIEIVFDEIRPRLVYNDIKDIDGILAQYSTKFNIGETDRSDNIKLACNRIDSIILLPGDEFSMNSAIGPRTRENGYKEAPVIIRNELVPGIGGGVCQVSSTMYNAVLLAGLKVTEREHHSMPLAYVGPGRDATITGDEIDFKFANNTDYPVFIKSYATAGVLSMAILGRMHKDGTSIRLKTDIIERYPPGEEELIQDDTLLPGERVVERKAVEGLCVVLYREIYHNDVLYKAEKLTVDYYKPINARVRVNNS